MADSSSPLYQFFSSFLSDDGPLMSGFLKSFPESGLLWQLFVNLRYPNFLLAIRVACIGFSLALTFANLPATMGYFRKGVAPTEPLFPLLAMGIDNMIGLWFSMYNKEPIGLVLRSLSVVLNMVYILPYVLFSPHSKYRLRVMFRLVLTALFAGTLRLVLPVLVPSSQMESVLGLLSTCAAIFFGMSPLSAAGQIIRNRDSSPISRPTAIALTLCALSWTVYGMILRQPWIALPNVVNLLLGGMQLVLCLMYPADSAATIRDKEKRRSDAASTAARRDRTLSKDLRARRRRGRRQGAIESEWNEDTATATGVDTSSTLPGAEEGLSQRHAGTD